MYLRCAAAWMLALAALLSPADAAEDPSDLQRIRRVFYDYGLDRDSRRSAQQPLGDDFYAFWEREFSRVSEETSQPSRDRVALLSELGAIRRELGMPDAAYEAWAEMGETALAAGLPFDASVAMNGLISLRRQGAGEELDDLAGRIERAFERVASAPAPRPEDLQAFGDPLAGVGRLYMEHGKELAAASDAATAESAATYYSRAIEALEKAAAIGEPTTFKIVERKRRRRPLGGINPLRLLQLHSTPSSRRNK